MTRSVNPEVATAPPTRAHQFGEALPGEAVLSIFRSASPRDAHCCGENRACGCRSGALGHSNDIEHAVSPDFL